MRIDKALSLIAADRRYSIEQQRATGGTPKLYRFKEVPNDLAIAFAHWCKGDQFSRARTESGTSPLTITNEQIEELEAMLDAITTAAGGAELDAPDSLASAAIRMRTYINAKRRSEERKEAQRRQEAGQAYICPQCGTAHPAVTPSENH